MKIRKEKEEKPYKMQLQLPNKILRRIFWGILLFVFLRGIISFIRPDKTVETLEQVHELKGLYSEEIKLTTEIENFAKDFIYNWTTYKKDGKVDFENSIEKYVYKELLKENPYDFKTDSSNIYVNSYRVENTGTSIWYVYVKTKVSQTVLVEEKKVKETEKETETKVEKEVKAEKVEMVVTEEYIYKVPVEVTEGKYLIRYLPQIVNDDFYYEVESSIVDSIPDGFEEIKNVGVIETSIINFLKSYYSEDQSVIDYYLDTLADKDKFITLQNKSFVFASLKDFKVYKNQAGVIYANVKYNTINANEVTYLQNVWFELVELSEDNRIYIRNMELSIENLKRGGF